MRGNRAFDDMKAVLNMIGGLAVHVLQVWIDP